MSRHYSKIRGQLETGDIVLFSGKGGISAGIKWGTLSRWSHVAMVLNVEEYDYVTLWESTTLSNVADLDSGKATKGVQLVPMSARVRKYDGEIAVRQLRDVSFGADERQELMKLRRELTGRPYEEDMIELIKSAWDGPFGHNEEDLSSLFCSEMVAEAYQRLGLIDTQTQSNEYTPADFAEGRGLELRQGRLGPETIIKNG